MQATSQHDTPAATPHAENGSGADASTDAAANRARLHQFRRANARIGFICSCSLMLANVLYLSTTAGEPNRGLLWALQGAAIAIGTLTIAIARRWRPSRLLMHVWTSSQILIIVLAATADGGLTSPFLAMLFVPLAVTALALKPEAMLGHTGLAIVGVVAAGYATDTFGLGATAIWAASLGSLVVVGLGVGDNTRRLTRRLQAANEELLELSRSDALTGCLNHRSFYEEADVTLARAARSGSPVALLLLDIDHFKVVNDEHGHPTGDAVLVAVADALRTSTRAGDIVARTGGEEFAVLMADTDLDEAAVVAERVRQAVAQAGGPVAVTASAGLAGFPQHGASSARLVRVADQALYAAKDGGRDRLVTVAG